ncbi:MAG: response receiver sensor histidine kinase response regulator, partial [Rhodospirillales bacterium]|nr:response receiver sensor histidine kinase response regulator [Rhodospirillales bacterium]
MTIGAGQTTDIDTVAKSAPAEEKYRLFADATEEGIVIHDYKRVLAANNHFPRMFGYAADQIEGMDPFAFVAPINRIPIESIPDESASEALGLRADGSVFPVELKGRNVTYQGTPARIITVRDLTKRHQVEATLNASEERFRATFELAAVGLAHVATDGTWLRVNRRLCEMTGYKRDELLEKTFQDITHPLDLDADLEQLNALLAGQRDNYSMEKRYFRKDCSTIWVNLTVSFVRGAAGQPPYFISIVEDISTRKAMEETLRQSQKMEVVGQLTSSIAHDFGNFLNVIKGNLQLLEPYQISTRPSEYLKSALAGTDLAEKLIRQLLSFSRRQEPEFETVDVNVLIQDVRGLLRRAASDRVVLRFSLHEPGCPIICDRAQLETALFNLVLNARDALGAGKSEILIKTTIATNPTRYSSHPERMVGDYVQIDVGDNGHGMPAGVAARACEPFFTTKGLGEGTGLGLSQVARCMAQ